MKQTVLNKFLVNIQKPFLTGSEEYDIMKDIGSQNSPAVAAVLNLQKRAGLLGPSMLNRVVTDPLSDTRDSMRMEKDSSAYASAAISTNPNIAHDVESRHNLKKVFNKPSEYIDGFHVDEIREQHNLLKEFEKSRSSNRLAFITPPSKSSEKAKAWSYRNNLDTEFTSDMWMNNNNDELRKRSNDDTAEGDDDSKPQFDWIKAVRKECLSQMKNTMDKEKKVQVVALFKCIGRESPKDLFHDVKTVWDTSTMSNYSVEETVELMLAFFN